MRKIIVSLTAVGLLAGPLTAAAGANPIEYLKQNGIPSNCHEWNEMLGIHNVKDCDG